MLSYVSGPKVTGQLRTGGERRRRGRARGLPALARPSASVAARLQAGSTSTSGKALCNAVRTASCPPPPPPSPSFTELSHSHSNISPRHGSAFHSRSGMVQVFSQGHSRSLEFAAVSAPEEGVVAVGGVQFSNKFGLEPGLPTGISFATTASPDAPCLTFAPTGAPSAITNNAVPITPAGTSSAPTTAATPTASLPGATLNTVGPITPTAPTAVWWGDGVVSSDGAAFPEVKHEGVGDEQGGGGANIVVDVWVLALIIGGMTVLVLVTTVLFVRQIRKSGHQKVHREQNVRYNVTKALAALYRLENGDDFAPRPRRVSGTDASGAAIYAEIDDILYEPAEEPRLYEYDEQAFATGAALSVLDGKRQLAVSPINPMFPKSFSGNGGVGVPRDGGGFIAVTVSSSIDDNSAHCSRSPDLEWDGTGIYDGFDARLGVRSTMCADGFYTVR